MKRNPELDGLRGLAATAVVVTHSVRAFHWGQLGVDLFFVLSGYLITTIIVEDREKPRFLREFYLKRLLRIWPVYYLTLLAVLIGAALSHMSYSPVAVAMHLAFVQNTSIYFGLVPPTFPFSFLPSWSVAIEEQYYLLWPILILWLRPRAIPWLSLLLLSACIIGRTVWTQGPGVLLTRGDGLACGCLLAWLCWRSSTLRVQQFALLAQLAGAAAFVATVTVLWNPGDTVMRATAYATPASLFFAGLVGTCVVWSGRWFLAPLRMAPLRWCGTISYALYLTHLPVMTYAPSTLHRLGVSSPVAIQATTWFLIVVVPILSWFMVERPILHVRPWLIKLVQTDRRLEREASAAEAQRTTV